MLNLDIFNSIKASAETNTRVFTPQKIVNEMLDELPEDVWNSKTTFLDPAVKSGVFLVEIFNRLFDNPELIKEYPDQKERKEHIYKEQLFGVAIDGYDYMISQRNLYRQLRKDSNIRIIDNYLELVKNKDTRFYTDAIAKEFGQDMKFNVIIGNPPYQKESERGTQGAVSIYTNFMQVADAVSTRLSSMIVPARWLSNAGSRGVDMAWVKQQLVSNEYMEICLLDSKEVFESVEIKGGIMYYIKDHTYCGMCSVNGEMRYLDDAGVGKFIASSIEAAIIRKIVEKSKRFMNKIVSSYSPFGLQSNVICKTSGNVRLHRTRGEIENISESEIPKGHDILKQYKVFVPLSYGDGKKGEILNNIKVVGPMDACTSTYVAIYPTSEKYVAENVAKYLHTKFFNLLIGEVKVTQSASKEVYQLVPVQDFTSASDIDWSQSISDIDQQLYKKYDLSDDEIAYIEKTIKPMQYE